MLLAQNVDNLARVEASANYQLTQKAPLWLSLKVLSSTAATTV